MRFIPWLVETERRFAWSLMGTIVGVLSLLLAFVAIREKRPRITYEITGATNVLDVHRPRPDLRIFFRARNLAESDLNLRILVIRLQNDGGLDILQNQYDSRQPWGFTVVGGSPVEIRVAAASTPYLRQNISPAIHDNTITLNKVIFERHRYATLELLVVHRRMQTPQIVPFGKIAGIDNFPVIALEPAGSASVWSEAAAGRLTVQAARALIYWLVFLVVISCGLLVTVPIAKIAVSLRRRRRAAQVRWLLRQDEDQFVRSFAELYRDGGRKALLAAGTLLSDSDRLRRDIELTKYFGLLRYPKELDSLNLTAVQVETLLWDPAIKATLKILDAGIAKPYATGAAIDPQARPALEQVSKYVGIKSET